MEYHKHRGTPLDRIDGKLLEELLRLDDGCRNDHSNCDNINRCKGTNKYEGRCGSIYGKNNSKDNNSFGRNGREKDKCPCGEFTDATCDSGCGDFDDYKLPSLEGNPLSMVYSPYQKWGNLYDPDQGHSRGTIFKCLDFPFNSASCKSESNCGCKYR